MMQTTPIWVSIACGGLLACSSFPSVPDADTANGQATVSAQCSALMANPVENADPWFQLGNALVELDRLDEAEFAYRKALKYSNDPRIEHNLGLLHLRLGVQSLQAAGRKLPVNDPARINARAFTSQLLRTPL
ncbi:tetratricopeptide repeat protein [Plasticicumulans acidivorans]|uniref:Tetratricopeptide repeat protein n=2 Tax=Plasticicumulans acidivorans TaxID=886464 RepID=A0A317MRP7_9GAMM|nr:tetratricopeptide repeat protein [Plasticicumulans acidivorans]